MSNNDLKGKIIRIRKAIEAQDYKTAWNEAYLPIEEETSNEVAVPEMDYGDEEMQ